MTDTTVGTPVPAKRRGWLRAIAWICGVLVLLVVVVYFVATSSAFFKGVILPRVGKAMNAQVTVSDASISPFNHVILSNLKVQTTGTEPLVTATEVRLRYSLMDIIRGTIRVDEVALVSPTVTLVQNADGSSNLDPIMKSQSAKAPEKQPAPAAKAPGGKPLQIDLKKFALTDATIRQVKNYTNGAPDVTELSHVTVTLDDLKNGQTGKLGLAADIRVQNTNGVLQAKLAGNFDLALAADLKPASIKGSTRLDVSKAEGALADLAAFGSELNVEVTPTDIKEVALRFKKGDTRLGELRVSGPFDMQKLEGRLSIVLAGIDKQLLNLAGVKGGLDFGGTTISSTNLLELVKGGSVISLSGQFDLSSFQVTRQQQTTPRLDLRKEYSVTVDRGQSTATISRLAMTGTENGNTVLKAELANPMQIGWGNAKNAVGDSTLTLTISGLNLADWKPFMGEAGPAGIMNAKARLVSQQGGQQLTFDLDYGIDHLAVNAGSNHITDAAITLQASGKATDLKQFNLTSYKLEFARLGQPLVSVSASGTYDQASESADMQVAVKAALAPLLQAVPQPDMSITSGTIDLTTHVTQKQKAQAVTGTFTLADFTGRFGKNEISGLGTAVDFDVAMTPQQVQVRKAAGKLTQGGKAGGSFDLTATYDLAQKTATLTAKLADFNQVGLGQFLQPMLADKKLVSIAINANASVQYDPQGASAVKADVQVTNLVVNDPQNQFPATPLEAKMQVDTSLRKQVLDLRQFQVTLTPTVRATNQVQLSGQVDMSQTNAIQGNLKLVADSIDVTSYYDLFMAGKQAPATRTAAIGSPTASGLATPPAPATAPADPNKEPDAMPLPLQNFVFSAAIGHFYLHEIDIADWQTTLKIDGGHVVLNPFKLTLNGAPVNTTLDMDLGVPGFKYNWALSAQAIPLAPLVNSFQPDRKGILSGTLTAQAKLGGAGTTGASLQKNLTGQFDMASTNLNLSVDNIQGSNASTRLLKTVVKTITAIPDLAKNPGGTATSLLQGLVGSGSSSSSSSSSKGAAADLSKSPINSIILRGAAGSGRVDLQQAVIQSPAFEANAAGTITLDAVLTNSTIQIPVSVSLERSVAQRINLAGNTPTNATYAKLPDFLTMKGTVGNAKSDINYIALASAALTASGKGGQNSSTLQSLGGFLSKGTNSSSSAGTNQSGSKASGLLNNVNSFLGNSSSAATNAPATNQSPASSLLNGLFGPKKK